jgi:uncharacterized membrane protein
LRVLCAEQFDQVAASADCRSTDQKNKIMQQLLVLLFGLAMAESSLLDTTTFQWWMVGGTAFAVGSVALLALVAVICKCCRRAKSAWVQLT